MHANKTMRVLSIIRKTTGSVSKCPSSVSMAAPLLHCRSLTTSTTSLNQTPSQPTFVDKPDSPKQTPIKPKFVDRPALTTPPTREQERRQRRKGLNQGFLIAFAILFILFSRAYTAYRIDSRIPDHDYPRVPSYEKDED